MAHRKRVLNIFGGFLWNSNFLLQLRCPIGIGLRLQNFDDGWWGFRFFFRCSKRHRSSSFTCRHSTSECLPPNENLAFHTINMLLRSAYRSVQEGCRPYGNMKNVEPAGLPRTRCFVFFYVHATPRGLVPLGCVKQLLSRALKRTKMSAVSLIAPSAQPPLPPPPRFACVQLVVMSWFRFLILIVWYLDVFVLRHIVIRIPMFR